MALKVRTRFEVFKRDDFTCQYCGKKSPQVVLEVDHIVPVAEGGSDDVINLRTSCWECNRGKSDTPLTELVTGEDPYDRAVLLLERERQLREYNAVLRAISDRVDIEYGALEQLWPKRVSGRDQNWLRAALERYPFEVVRNAMDVAINNGRTRGFAYMNAVLRNRKKRGEF